MGDSVRNGYYGGRYYISASVLGEFVWDGERGIKRWLGIRERQSKEAKRGVVWHKKLGYDNNREFSRELVLDDNTVVVLFGVPDYCGDGVLEELKTVGGDFVSRRKLESARVQLLVYLYVLGLDVGRLVFVSRRTGDVVYVEEVRRDDEYLKELVSEFVREVVIRL